MACTSEVNHHIKR